MVARAPGPWQVVQGGSSTYSQSSSPRCPWGQGHRGDGHLQRKQEHEHGTQVSMGKVSRGGVLPQERPVTPGWGQGSQTSGRRVSDAVTSLGGKLAYHPKDKAQMPWECCSARGLALRHAWIWPGAMGWLRAGTRHIPSQRTKALAASSMLRMSQR